jgi:hypothetical protein
MFFRGKKSALYGATMSDGMVADARETVREILAAHRAEPLDRDLAKQGEKILAEYERAPPSSA